MPTPLIIPGYPDIPQLESRQGTILIGWYTFVLHFLAGFYFLDVYRGGSSDWILSPLFDYPQEASRTYALALVIYSFSFMFFGSIGLIKGVEAETRIYYFPWIIFTIIEIALIIQRGVHILWRYSYDANSTITGVIILMYAIFHIYLYHVVMSNYKFLKKLQNPTLIFPSEI